MLSIVSLLTTYVVYIDHLLKPIIGVEYQNIPQNAKQCTFQHPPTAIATLCWTYDVDRYNPVIPFMES